VVGIAILLCVTLAFVAVTSKNVATRIFFALFCIGTAVACIGEYRTENALAHDHLVVSGTVTELKKGRRGGRSAKYEFTAFDGKQYEGESGLGRQRVQVGSEVLVVYKPQNPSLNKAAQGFLFYSFQSTVQNA
jgi:hypothetical protein